MAPETRGTGLGFEESPGVVGGVGVGAEPGVRAGARIRGVSWPGSGLVRRELVVGVFLRLLYFCAAFTCWTGFVRIPLRPSSWVSAERETSRERCQ